MTCVPCTDLNPHQQPIVQGVYHFTLFSLSSENVQGLGSIGKGGRGHTPCTLPISSTFESVQGTHVNTFEVGGGLQILDTDGTNVPLGTNGPSGYDGSTSRRASTSHT